MERVLTWSKKISSDGNGKGQIRVVLADDHAVVRVGIRRLLSKTEDIYVVAEVDNGLDAIEAVRRYKPDVLLLDMEMPVMNGIEVAKRLHELNSPVRVLVLSGYEDSQYIRLVIAAGACGYITKGENPDVILRAIRAVAGGVTGWVSPQVLTRLGTSFP
jgi:DNA-binding NarL/FixJ family response regulator